MGADQALARGGRRSRGAFFTPAPLCAAVAAEALRARFAGPVRWRDDGTPRLRVLDPAAGDGRFLAAAVDWLVAAAGRRGVDPDIVRASIVRRCVVGIERDPGFAALARARLGPGAVIHTREALLDPPRLGPIDVVIGNPPYLRSIHLAESDPALWRALRGRYAATSHREWDLYGAFIEQSLEWVGKAGEVALVVPSRWLTAAFAERLRAKLARQAAVRGVIDFGAEQIFAGATTYASVVFLSRTPSPAIGVARRGDSSWRCGIVDGAALGGAPWRLSVGRCRVAIDRLGASGIVLGDVARIAKGTGTNADRVFVLEDCEPVEPDLVRARSAAAGAEPVVIEAALVRACYRGRDVRALDPAPPAAACLVPYTREGRLLEPDEMAAHFPRALAYLQSQRAILDARERGRFRGPTFYRFGRPQNLAFLGDPAPKIVVPDIALDGRAAIDCTGALVLDSAYALRLAGDSRYTLAALAAILSSPAVALWLRETGVPLRGGYVRMKTAYLASLPLPAPGPALARAAALAEQSDIGATALAVRAAYDMPARDWCTLAP